MAIQYRRTWRNKFLTLEAKSIGDMISAMEQAAAELKEMKAAGVTMVPDSAGDDYAQLVTTDPDVAKRFQMDDPLDDEDEEF